ncbi:hypothetical protein ACJIZ3_014188 [Penstemon smallii]|uniref:Rx N-terminal domain-containing protein n=1 Tax=Penstemon smallii TaxID=265156 RepID=A0ABD3RJ28_9LAMI
MKRSELISWTVDINTAADAEVPISLENVFELIGREADLLTGVKEKVEWIENKFQVMVDLLQKVEALPEVPDDVNGYVSSSRKVIRKAEDVIETYAKIVAKRNTAAFYKKLFHWFKVRNQSMELEKIKNEIMEVEKGWLEINFNVVSKHETSANVMGRLESYEVLCGSGGGQEEHLECVKWVRGELAPLNDFLKKIDRKRLEFGERREYWIRELEYIFTELGNSLDHSNFLKSDLSLSKIQSKILDLYRRYYTFGIGEFCTQERKIPISPRIRMNCPVPGGSSSSSSSSSSDHDIYRVNCLVKEINHLMGESTSRDLLNRVSTDLEMMHDLIKDGRVMKDKDERLKVWLNQVKDIFDDFQAIMRGTTWSQPENFSREDLDQIDDEICRMAGRKTMYGICNSAVGADCRLYYYSTTSAFAISKAPDDHSSRTSTQLLKTFTRELELMQALFEDVKTHVGPLDERLKIWLQELKLVAHETESVLELLSDTQRRTHAQRRCEKLNRRICTMSIWKHTYGVGDVKSSASSSISIDHQLGDGETVPYPSEDMDDEIDLIRRELKLMHALDRDITSKMDEVDGDTKAWVEKMRNVARKVEGMLRSDNIVGTDDVDQIKDDIRELFKRRVTSDIQLESNSIPELTNNNQMQDRSDALEYKDTINTSVPPYLKQCINHFSLFPSDFEVPARRLKVLWIAEGLARPKNGETAEHVAENYLQELVQKKLVEVTKKKVNGNVKACRLTDEARDEWLPKAAEESRFLKDEQGIISRLVDHHNGTTTTTTDSVKQYRNVISFLSFDTQEGKKSGERIGNFVDKCIASDCFLELRILDLEKVFRPKLPKSVSKLVRLRYIGLRWTFLEKLPKFVNKLLNLQVLDVKHTYINTLPRSIWSMQYLQHLYLSETYRTKFPDRPSSATSSLTALQTLWGAFVDETTCVKQGLDTLLHIRKLGLSCRSTSSQRSNSMSEQLRAVDKWISNLSSLESLRLKSRDKNGDPSYLHLSPLTNHQNLSTVYLLGKLKPSVVYGFPSNLIDVTLSSSELGFDPMSYLEKLPKLVILRLLSKSVVYDWMLFTNGGFPQLKVLKLWKLEFLKDLEIEKGAMPCLEDLEIRSCNNLEMLPDGLQNLEKLTKLKLTLMPKEFIDKTEETQAELWSKLEHVLEFEPVRNGAHN